MQQPRHQRTTHCEPSWLGNDAIHLQGETSGLQQILKRSSPYSMPFAKTTRRSSWQHWEKRRTQVQHH